MNTEWLRAEAPESIYKQPGSPGGLQTELTARSLKGMPADRASLLLQASSQVPPRQS